MRLGLLCIVFTLACSSGVSVDQVVPPMQKQHQVALKARCGTVDYAGECRGDVAVWCSDSSLRRRDCGSVGQGCGYLNEELGYYCKPRPQTAVDSDDDGIPDTRDRCSATPRGAPVWPDGMWAGCAGGQYVDRDVEPEPEPDPELEPELELDPDLEPEPQPEPQPEPEPDPEPEPQPDNNCEHVPSYRCDPSTTQCGELVPFLPERGDGYWNYPLNGETIEDQYRSFARRDLVMLVKYATAKTRCLSANWPMGSSQELGLGDMSEADGSIPGTREGDAGHPSGTHTNGRDMDIAYYQVGTQNNHLRAVCDHYLGSRDAYHCVGTPSRLDVRRTALFIALLHDSPRLRVIGVDGQVGPLVDAEIDGLCERGVIDGPACSSGRSIAWETTDRGQGWYRFHHHHLHVSLMSGRYRNASSSGQRECLIPGCPNLRLPSGAVPRNAIRGDGP
jgi:hypothetical protein